MTMTRQCACGNDYCHGDGPRCSRTLRELRRPGIADDFTISIARPLEPFTADEAKALFTPTPPARKRVTSEQADRLFNLHDSDRYIEGFRVFGASWPDIMPYFKEADLTPLPTPRPVPRNLIDLVGAP